MHGRTNSFSIDLYIRCCPAQLDAIFCHEFPYFVPPSSYGPSPSSRHVSRYPLCHPGGPFHYTASPSPFLFLDLNYDIFCSSSFSDPKSSFPGHERYSYYFSLRGPLSGPKFVFQLFSKAPSFRSIRHRRQNALVVYSSFE